MGQQCTEIYFYVHRQGNSGVYRKSAIGKHLCLSRLFFPNFQMSDVFITNLKNGKWKYAKIRGTVVSVGQME
jgi:hypothetical protein